MNKKFSLMMALILTALMAQAQDNPPDATWESDPLDVLESQQKDVVEPTVPEFQEIPEEGAAVPAPAAPDVAAPENSFEEVAPGAPAEVAPPPTETVESSPAVTPSTTVGSEPDFSREAEFHRIYKSYNEQPTSVELWEKAVGARESEVYQIQKGDTLWGVSTTFFGDPNFWPKIWSLNNGSITNPHEISPLMNIQFFPGTADEAPTLDLADASAVQKDATAPAAAATVADVKSTAGATIPRPKKRAPLLKTLPESLPQYRMGVLRDTAVELQVELPKNQFPTAPEYLEYYMTDTPVTGVGRVTATEMDMKTAGEYQFIYVQLDDSGSKEFVAQKNLTKVADPLVKKREGQMVELQGQIEVLEKVNDQQNIYRAIVKKSLQPIEVGALLTPGRLPMIDPSAAEITSGVGARIMGGQFDRKRNIFGNNTLVFLDGGSGQGLQEGQSLAIFADERVRNKKNQAVMNDRVIGTVKIVRVSPNFATGYVVRASDNVVVGDYVGKPMTQAMNFAPVVEAPAKVDSDFEKEFDEAPADTPAPDTGSEDSDLDF
ncbi:LysM peptidoglycan-binding domain-containing protein [Bdellovibrio bacteriovorus]|uniref:LysM peptidoglycan-binding domain-containing protein n=1 Tax=Bdellovibrio bacteriovorus TaxID=959 RepID=UPI0021CE9294|nr:LysM peptidoglycan-binding domain-containing protein [Bdellovibrio bacteriovorus]UXR63148.1 LysM peptidoglycan-binding domain-containing protein [Bdellovibrio bacteriovorus]